MSDNSGYQIMELLPVYFNIVSVPQKMVRLEKMVDYNVVRLQVSWYTYICTYIQKHNMTHTHTHTCTCTRTHTCTCAHAHVHTHTHTHTHVHTHTYTHTHTHTHMHTHTHTQTNTHTHTPSGPNPVTVTRKRTLKLLSVNRPQLQQREETIKVHCK